MRSTNGDLTRELNRGGYLLPVAIPRRPVAPDQTILTCDLTEPPHPWRPSSTVYWDPGAATEASKQLSDGPLVSCQADPWTNFLESGFRRLELVLKRQEPRQKEPVMGRAGRPTVAIELTDGERETLVRWSRRHSSAQALALRPRIVLACADGTPNTKIADELGCDRVTVGRWRHRFAAERLEGLVDAPRPGAARTISDEVEARSKRSTGPHRSCRCCPPHRCGPHRVLAQDRPRGHPRPRRTCHPRQPLHPQDPGRARAATAPLPVPLHPSPTGRE